MKKGLIISNILEKHEKEIRKKLSYKYLLHFSSDMNFLSYATISGEIAFIAFNLKTLLFNFILFFSKINAMHYDIPVFLISDSYISDKTMESVERFISHKIMKSYCLETDVDDFIDDIDNLPERKVNKNISVVYNALIGKSENIENLRLFILNASKHEESVLLLGETGCGKTSVAELIHDLSDRKDKNLISIDMGTIPTGLMEAILFGAKKGSYTGAYEDKKGLIEEANHGILFLDEIENMPLDVQVKLLRVLETHKIRAVGGNTEKEIDFRLICASNKNLSEMVREGKFRQDLYYRINVLNFEIQPLRERKTDIDDLSRYYVKKHNFRITDEALNKLKSARLNGNVRELFSIIKRAYVIAGYSKIIYPEHIVFD